MKQSSFSWRSFSFCLPQPSFCDSMIVFVWPLPTSLVQRFFLMNTCPCRSGPLKDCWITAGHELMWVSVTRVWDANTLLSCINRKRPGRNTKLSLCSIRKACARFMCPTYGTLQERLERVWRSAMGTTRDVENMTHMGRLEGLGLFVYNKKRLRVETITVLKCMKSFCKEEENFSLFLNGQDKEYQA